MFKVYQRHSEECVGEFDFEQSPVLGATIGDDANHVIACIRYAPEELVYVVPRIIVCHEKPFLTLDLHLSSVFCAQCGELIPIELFEREQFCPVCGTIGEFSSCLNTDKILLEFNRFAVEHDCAEKNDDAYQTGVIGNIE